ncbi:MAG: hypothetical protein IJJ50_05750 [Lachnospiraceae bacterium]|nr:hypothetical protein [Lachnospiraceae bacterium]
MLHLQVRCFCGAAFADPLVLHSQARRFRFFRCAAFAVLLLQVRCFCGAAFADPWELHSQAPAAAQILAAAGAYIFFNAFIFSNYSRFSLH